MEMSTANLEISYNHRVPGVRESGINQSDVRYNLSVVDIYCQVEKDLFKYGTLHMGASINSILCNFKVYT